MRKALLSLIAVFALMVFAPLQPAAAAPTDGKPMACENCKSCEGMKDGMKDNKECECCKKMTHNKKHVGIKDKEAMKGEPAAKEQKAMKEHKPMKEHAMKHECAKGDKMCHNKSAQMQGQKMNSIAPASSGGMMRMSLAPMLNPHSPAKH